MYYFRTPTFGEAYSKLLILSFELKFLCADMFPYEDSEILSLCPPVYIYIYPKEKMILAFSFH